jgi:hypothetical protein
MSYLSYVKEPKSELSKKCKTFTDLQTRDHVLMNKIIQYYEKDKNLQTLQSVIHGKSTLSLRIIDYFVTNYAKENEVIYDIGNEKFMVYHSYKSQLKAYSKKQFDPFCRRDRILLYIDKDNFIRTTVGQLNFFRWAITSNILTYIESYYKEIEYEMNFFSKKNMKKYSKKNMKKYSKKNTKEYSKKNTKEYSKKNTKKSSKKIVEDTKKKIVKNKVESIIIPDNHLEITATKKINRHNVTITVKFN